MERETEEKGVSREEFEAFKKAFSTEVKEIKDMVCDIASRLQEPPSAGVYRCSEEGCAYVTDDLREYVEHTINERLRKLAPKKETAWGEETPKTHSTVRDYLDCAECFPKFVDAMLEHPKFQKKLEELGWQKPEAKPKRKGLGI